MRNILNLTALLLFLAGSFYSCTKKEKEFDLMDIAFTEYSLIGTFCQWTNLNYDNNVITINSNNELENHIEGSSYPAIDFSKNTLLLVHGTCHNSIADISKRIQKISNKRVLTVEITTKPTCQSEKWILALITNKSNEKVDLENIYTETAIVKFTPPEDHCNAYMIAVVHENGFDKLYKPNQLSKQFEIDNLKVMVTYRMSEEKHNCGFGGYVPVINIMKIEKQ